LKELRDGSDLILRGIELQIVGAANRTALRQMVVVVKGTCKRLSKEEWRALLVVFKLMRDDKYEGIPECRARYVKMAILKLMRLLIGSQWSWRRAETDGSARSLMTIFSILARVL